MSAQAFSAARRKLPAEFVREVLGAAADEFDRDFGDRHRWHGRRLLAVDGAKRHCRPSPELVREFGRDAGGHYPQMLLCTLFDVVAEVPLDAVMGRGAGCERTDLVTLTRSVRPGDVLVADRGFQSFDVFVWIRSCEADFVVRLPASHGFKVVDEFLASGEREAVVDLPRPDGVKSPPEITHLTVRLVRVARRDGSFWVLATSLPADEFPAEAVSDAYERRWRVEEFYKLLVDDYFDQGAFHSKCADGVRQEVYAQLLFVVLARSLMAAAAEEHRIEYRELSRKAAVLATGDTLVRLLGGADPRRRPPFLRRLLKRIARALEPPRPGRSAPRRSRRPRPKWTATGRRGGR